MLIVDAFHQMCIFSPNLNVEFMSISLHFSVEVLVFLGKMHHEMLLRFAVVLPNKKRQANGSSDGSCCYIRMHCVLLNKQKMSPDPPYKQKTRRE